MPAYPLDPYSEITVIGYIPDNAGNRWTPFLLPDGPGVYEFAGFSGMRTAGIASLKVAPVIGLANPSAGNEVLSQAIAPILYQPFPVGSFIVPPTYYVGFIKVATANLFIATEPDVFGGDVFTATLRIRRVF